MEERAIYVPVLPTPAELEETRKLDSRLGPSHTGDSPVYPNLTACLTSLLLLCFDLLDQFDQLVHIIPLRHAEIGPSFICVMVQRHGRDSEFRFVGSEGKGERREVR